MPSVIIHFIVSEQADINYISGSNYKICIFISPMFITDFELYLRTACKCGYNTTAKFMQFFKRIIIIARNNGILVGDPFASYKIRLEKVDRGYLTEDEIKIILKKKMVSERLEHVRDLFVFSCFCGLAYSDVANLRQELQLWALQLSVLLLWVLPWQAQWL